MSLFGKHNPWARLLAGTLAGLMAVTNLPAATQVARAANGNTITFNFTLKDAYGHAMTQTAPASEVWTVSNGNQYITSANVVKDQTSDDPSTPAPDINYYTTPGWTYDPDYTSFSNASDFSVNATVAATAEYTPITYTVAFSYDDLVASVGNDPGHTAYAWDVANVKNPDPIANVSISNADGLTNVKLPTLSSNKIGIGQTFVLRGENGATFEPGAALSGYKNAIFGNDTAWTADGVYTISAAVTYTDYKLKLDPNGGKDGRTEKFLLPMSNGVVNLSGIAATTTRDGYDLQGFNVNKDLSYVDASAVQTARLSNTLGATVTADDLEIVDTTVAQTIYPIWTIKQFTATFSSNLLDPLFDNSINTKSEDGSISVGDAGHSATVKWAYGKGFKLSSLQFQSKDGWSFKGFYEDANYDGVKDNNTKMTDIATSDDDAWNVDLNNKHYVAFFEADKITNTYDFNGGTMSLSVNNKKFSYSSLTGEKSYGGTATVWDTFAAGRTAEIDAINKSYSVNNATWVAPAQPEKEGYTFKGFFDASDADNEEVQKGNDTWIDAHKKNAVDDSDDAITYVAGWAVTKYNVTLSNNGQYYYTDGLATSKKELVKEYKEDSEKLAKATVFTGDAALTINDSITLPSATEFFKDGGESFLYWSVPGHFASIKLTPGSWKVKDLAAKFKNEGLMGTNFTLVPVWKAGTITIEYVNIDGDMVGDAFKVKTTGGFPTSVSTKVPAGFSIANAADLRDGYTFVNYYTSASSDAECVDDPSEDKYNKWPINGTSYLVSDVLSRVEGGKLTVYAKWTPKKYRFSYRNTLNATARKEVELAADGTLIDGTSLNIGINSTSGNDNKLNLVGWAVGGIYAASDATATATLSSNDYNYSSAANAGSTTKNTYVFAPGTDVATMVKTFKTTAGALVESNVSGYVLLPVYKATYTVNYTASIDGKTVKSEGNGISLTDKLPTTAPSADFVRNGYTIVGWNINTAAGNPYQVTNEKTIVTWGKVIDDGAAVSAENALTATPVYAQSYDVNVTLPTGAKVVVNVVKDVKNHDKTIFAAAAITEEDYKKDGKSFKGFVADWQDAATATAIAGSTELGNSKVTNLLKNGTETYTSITLVPVYKAAQYKIDFYGANKTTKISSATITKTYGEGEVNLIDGTSSTYGSSLAVPGLVFDSWNTENDGTGTSYANAAKITDISTGADVKLYPVYKSATLAITYDQNDAQFTKVADGAATKIEGKMGTINLVTKVKDNTAAMTTAGKVTATLAAPAYKANGMEFKGWATSATATTATIEKQADGNYYLAEANIKAAVNGGNALTLYAVWGKKQNKITFEANGATVTPADTPYTIDKKDKEVSPVLSGIANYNLDGWFYDSSFKKAVAAGSSAGKLLIPAGTYGDLTLYAKLSGKEATISFDANDEAAKGSMKDIKTQYGLSYTLPKAKFKKTGYVFAGWLRGNKTSGTPVRDGETIAVNATSIILYATYKKTGDQFNVILNTGDKGTIGADYVQTAAAVGKYKYELVGTDNTYTGVYNYGSALTFPTVTPIDGYNFVNFTDVDTGAVVKQITAKTAGNLYLKANYSGKEYTATLVANTPAGGTLKGKGTTSTTAITFGTSKTIACPWTVAGYEFIGWAEKANEVDTDRIVKTYKLEDAANKTLYAIWAHTPYVITYHTNGGEIAENAYNKAKDPTANSVYYAYNYLSTTQKKITLVTPTRPGYKFEGWGTKMTNYKITGSAKTVASGKDIEVWAKWSAVVGVRYHDTENNATSVTNIDTKKSQNLVKFSKLGFKVPDNKVFIGWTRVAGGGDRQTPEFIDEQKVDLSETPYNGSVKVETTGTASSVYLDLYPIYQAARASYTVRAFNTSAGSVAAATVPAFATTYRGWIGTDLTPGADRQTEANQKTWIEAQTVKNVNTMQYQVGVGLSAKELKALGQTLTRQGYVFNYFKDPITGKKITSVGKKAIGDLNLIAEWKPVKESVSYTVDVAGIGTKTKIKGKDKTVKALVGKQIVTPKVSADGYYFIGWTNSRALAATVWNLQDINGRDDRNELEMVDKNKDNMLTTYHLTGEKGNGDDSVTVNEWKKFDNWAGGWMSAAPGGKVYVDTVAAGNTYYAVWATNIYNIKIDANGGSYTAAMKAATAKAADAAYRIDGNGPYTQAFSVHYNASGSLVAEPTNLGYTFASWGYKNAKGKVSKLNAKSVLKALQKGTTDTLIAQWKVVK